MVDAIKNMVNRVEVQKPRDRDFDSKAVATGASDVAPVARDTVTMSDAASPQVIAQLAEKPPVNAEAVNRIKSAIANGEYPINLDLISDALMDAYRDLKT